MLICQTKDTDVGCEGWTRGERRQQQKLNGVHLETFNRNKWGQWSRRITQIHAICAYRISINANWMAFDPLSVYLMPVRATFETHSIEKWGKYVHANCPSSAIYYNFLHEMSGACDAYREHISNETILHAAQIHGKHSRFPFDTIEIEIAHQMSSYIAVCGSALKFIAAMRSECRPKCSSSVMVMGYHFCYKTININYDFRLRIKIHDIRHPHAYTHRFTVYAIPSGISLKSTFFWLPLPRSVSRTKRFC